MIGSILGVHLSTASLFLRLAVGTLFVVHGYPKLSAQRKSTGEWLKSIGFSSAFAGFAGVVEFFGGLALLLGILTQIVAVLSALWMLSTTWLAAAKMKKKYFGGYELDMTLMLAALALAMIGGGIYSLDFLFGI